LWILPIACCHIFVMDIPSFCGTSFSKTRGNRLNFLEGSISILPHNISLFLLTSDQCYSLYDCIVYCNCLAQWCNITDGWCLWWCVQVLRICTLSFHKWNILVVLFSSMWQLSSAMVGYNGGWCLLCTFILVLRIFTLSLH